MTRKYLTLVTHLCLGFTILIVFAIGWFIWAIVNDKPPQFFPLNNPKGKYFVTKNCPPQGNHDNPRPEDPGELYCVIYRGKNVFMNEDNGKTEAFTVMVAKSRIDLNTFENKYIKNIKGEFVNSSQQCIKDKCVDLGGPWVVLNIDNLEAVN